MLYTPHFLTGSAILKVIPNPAVGLPLALLSHILLDLIPHNDFDITPGMRIKDILSPKFKKRKLFIIAYTLDIFFSIASFFWILFTKNNYWLLVGGGVAVIPDVVEQGLLLFGIALPGWQDKFQWRVSAKYGFISYPIVSLLALYFLKR